MFSYYLFVSRNNNIAFDHRTNVLMILRLPVTSCDVATEFVCGFTMPQQSVHATLWRIVSKRLNISQHNHSISDCRRRIVVVCLSNENARYVLQRLKKSLSSVRSVASF